MIINEALWCHYMLEVHPEIEMRGHRLFSICHYMTATKFVKMMITVIHKDGLRLKWILRKIK